MSLSEAVGQHLRDGDHIAMGWFTHLIPLAAGATLVLPEKFRPSASVYLHVDLVNGKSGRIGIYKDGAAYVIAASTYNNDTQSLTSLEGVIYSRN